MMLEDTVLSVGADASAGETPQRLYGWLELHVPFECFWSWKNPKRATCAFGAVWSLYLYTEW